MVDQDTKTDKQERPNKDEIKGLPAHAQYQFRQGTWYVYFPYCFREDGKRKQERDYIGTLSPDGKEFLPNLYYVQNEPDFDHRPVERWKSPVMRHRALEKLNANKVETIAPSVSLDPELDCDQQLSVGATALCASILNANGMLKNVGTVLDNNPELTMACINLAMHSAITTDKTYLADKESTQQKFIGYGCLSSPRASEFFQRIGNEQTLSLKMAKACATHLEDGEILALDGTRVDCNSENISLAAIGKKKDGSYGPQINASLVINVKNGSPICYRAYAGNISDISTLDDLRKMLTDIGISEKSPLILMDRGYPNQEEFVNLDRDGYRFLIGAKTSMKLVKDVIDQKNCEFYDRKTYLRQQRCYGVKSKTAVSCDGHRMNIHSYVFRSPSKEMTETDELLDRLEAFQRGWPRKKNSVLSQADRKNLDFFVVTPNGNLLLDEERVSYECYCLGYFGLVGNVDITLMDALTKYRQRNEVEVAFKLMFQHLLTSTRVHSSAALDGLLMTTFVGLSILTYLRTKMNGTIPNELARNPERTSSINSLWTIQEMLKDLRRIKLAYTKSGKPRLLNVVKRDRDLAEALGFPGLFDSAENVAKLLSGSHLAATLKK